MTLGVVLDLNMLYYAVAIDAAWLDGSCYLGRSEPVIPARACVVLRLVRCWETKLLPDLVLKNLVVQRNRKTANMYALSLSFVFFVSVMRHDILALELCVLCYYTAPAHVLLDRRQRVMHSHVYSTPIRTQIESWSPALDNYHKNPSYVSSVYDGDDVHCDGLSGCARQGYMRRARSSLARTKFTDQKTE